MGYFGVSHGVQRSMACVVFSAATLVAHCGTAQAAPLLSVTGTSLTNYLPAGATSGQDVWPRHAQRGVGMDGALRSGSPQGFALSANPSAESWNAKMMVGSVRVDLATPVISDVDLALPTVGPSWLVGRTFNAAQKNGSSHRDSDGYQGKNWFQSSNPELRFYAAALTADDVVYLVYGADRYVEYKRSTADANVFVGTNGAAGAIKYVAGTSGEPDTWTLIDGAGNKAVYFGGNTASGAADWQLWKLQDVAGNVAYIGDATTASTAVTSGYSGKRPQVAYDAAGRRYTYTYTTIDSVQRLTQVKAETKTGGTWASPTGTATVAQVDYAYYTGSDANGDNGNLKTVTTTTPQSDTSVTVTSKTYYRYYTGSYNSSTNPGQANGLKLILGADGTRGYDYAGDSTFNDSFLSASTDNLKAYSDAYFEYENSTAYQVNKAFFNGQCGCGGGVNGQYQFTLGLASAYTTNIANTTYQSANALRNVIQRPDGTWETRYFDETHQPNGWAVTNSDPASSPTQTWASNVARDSAGRITSVKMPSNITAYSHATLDFTDSSSAGLTSGVSLISGGSDLDGFVSARKINPAGTGSGTDYVRSSTEWTTPASPLAVGTETLTRPLVSASWTYTQDTTSTATVGGGSNPSGAYSTTYTYNSFHSGDGALTPKEVTVSHNLVSTSNNGSGSAITSSSYTNTDGKVGWTKNTEGRISYTVYDAVTGLVTKSIQDADTSLTGSGQVFNGVTIPSGYSSSGTPLHLLTTYTYDAQGRLDTTTAPDGTVTKQFHTKLADGKMAHLGVPRVVTSGTTTYYGPASYTVTNQAGQTVLSATVAFSGGTTTTAIASWITTTAADPITALATGTITRLSTNVYSSDGQRLDEVRTYFSIPSTLPGTEGTHYDAVRYGYDGMGRRWRVKDATGTITRSVYDVMGRQTESWTGTNDSGFTGGESSGTDNMTKVEVREYDGGTAGKDSLLTKVTLDPDGNWATTTDQRETKYTYDGRNRLVLTENPLSPHSLLKYDSAGRTIAAATYSSVSGLSASSDPTSVSTNRLSLNETFYDERGQVFKTVTHKVSQSTGTYSGGDDLTSLTWYDAAGRRIKSKGSSISKTVYDRLGRATHHFDIATVDEADSSYADASTVSGDIVLEEAQATYDPLDGRPLMRATISRAHDDLANGSSGALDTNADGNSTKYTAADIKGRIQITAMWYDDLHRLTDSAVFGTNGSGNASDFDRKPSGSWLTVPTRSDTVRVTTSTYGDDGVLKEVTDSSGIKTRLDYDAARRVVKIIKNYIDGTPGGGTNGDEDQTVAYTFAKGLRTSITADLPSPQTDQVTTYIYGTTKGASAGQSQMASSLLLRAVKYPDSTNSGTTTANIDSDSSDVVSYAYNALGQQVYTKEQAGNVIEMDMDVAGRIAARRVTTLASGFDGAVRRIGLAYTSRGQTATVTQFDNATVGSGAATDEVKYTYDDYGNLTQLQQDRNSLVGASGSVDDQSVSWAYALAAPTGGSQMLRCTGETLPGSTSVTYSYTSSGNSMDDASGRVSKVTVGAVDVATYAYMGSGQVVGTDLPESNLNTRVYGSGAANYANVDRFGRITANRWADSTSDVDLYKVSLTYDRGSNITSISDAVHPGFDALYGMDNLNRLLNADEGTLSSGSISPRRRQEMWTLTQTGNWSNHKLDLNGDSAYGGADELNDTGTFNTVNELTARDKDTNASNDYTLAYDAVGNLTDDGENYTYGYDAFGRLVTVKNRSTSAVVAEYKYNGLNQRIGSHDDTDASGTVDSSDPWYWYIQDSRWRTVATFRASSWAYSGSNDTAPKETTVYHASGLGGRAGSSYIDSVILADKDMSNGWGGAADGTREKRIYLLQNWRADVSCVTDQSGKILEWIKYSPYGVPFRIDPADFDRDGDVDSADSSAFTTEYNNGTPRADANHDGFIDFTDYDLYMDNHSAASAGGRNVLSRGGSTSAGIHNRIGYAGYLWDSATSQYHVRNRVFLPSLGRWSRRDPHGYVDQHGLYQYVRSEPVNGRDPSGMKRDRTDGIGTGNDPGDGRMTDDQYCKASCEAMNQKKFTGGFTYCDGEIVKTCICKDPIGTFWPVDPTAACIGGDATQVHEDWHAKHRDCRGQPPRTDAPPKDDDDDDDDQSIHARSAARPGPGDDGRPKRYELLSPSCRHNCDEYEARTEQWYYLFVTMGLGDGCERGTATCPPATDPAVCRAELGVLMEEIMMQLIQYKTKCDKCTKVIHPYIPQPFAPF